MPYKIIKMGSLLLDGKPQRIPSNPVNDGDVQYYDGRAAISFGNALEGEKVTWVHPLGMDLLIADRCLLRVITSLIDLRDARAQVSVDGRHFMCRRPYFKKDKVNEWLDILKASGSRADTLWHWSGIRFLGEHLPQLDPDDPPVPTLQPSFGGTSATACNSYTAQGNTNSGFRPVLEPFTKDAVIFGRPVNLEGQWFRAEMFYTPTSTKSPNTVRIQPVLSPVNNDNSAGVPRLCQSALGGIKDGTELLMYSLLMDDEPIRQTGNRVNYKPGSTLTITDAYLGDAYRIRWTARDGQLVAQAPVLYGVDPDELINQGY